MMKRSILFSRAVCLAVCLFISTVSAFAQASGQPQELSRWRAHSLMQAAAKYAAVVWANTHRLYMVDTESIVITDTELRLTGVHKGESTAFHIALKDVSTANTGFCFDFACRVASPREFPFFLRDEKDKQYLLYFGDTPSMWKHPPCSDVDNKEACMKAAGQFAAALNGLHGKHVLYDPASFPQQATAWRALNPKPAISPEVKLRRTLAEDAIRIGKPEDALNYFELGLEIDPTWAQGWFNAAVIAGQLGYYADAAEHMQNYLALVPDAPDAESAREQMSVWKYKALRK